LILAPHYASYAIAAGSRQGHASPPPFRQLAGHAAAFFLRFASWLSATPFGFAFTLMLATLLTLLPLLTLFFTLLFSLLAAGYCCYSY
jgi:hypothetical protein